MISDTEILAMFSDCDFDQLDNCTWQDDVVSRLNIPESIQERIHFNYGASKGVILVDGWDWVIKVPFNGTGGRDYDAEDENGYTNSDGDWIGPDDPMYYHYDFEGANNSQNNWDYCRKEYEVYRAAEYEGVSDIFLAVEILGFVHGYPIYIQRRADSQGYPIPYHGWETSVTPEQKEIVNSISKSQGSVLSLSGLAAAVRDYGERFAARFNDFLCDMEIGDFHGQNVGALNGRIVLIDYSGYDEY